MILQRTRTLLLVVIAGLGLGSSCLAAEYTLTDLNTTPGFGIDLVNGIKNSGQVVGRGVPQEPRAIPVGVLWQNGRLTYPLGGSAIGINNSGQVVGGSFLWENGIITALPQVRTATAINSSGQIVGAINVNNVLHAILLRSGTTIDLVPGFANGINSVGQIVGGSIGSFRGGARIVGSSDSHALLWQNDTVTDLGLGYANAINVAGQIVGTSQSRAVLWQNGTMMTLGTGIAEAINADGVVVGGSGDPGGSRAFLWRNGTLTDLNDLIPADSGWTLFDATGINDAGQIVGQGSRGVFLLTPVPEPATLSLLGIGTLALIGWTWRRRELLAG